MQRSDPEDFQLKWQTFLIDGFPDWRGAAAVAATQLSKTTARDVLQGMIHDFYFPNGRIQSTDQIVNQLEAFAFAANARVRDKKTGQLVGNFRDLKRGTRPKPNSTMAPRVKSPMQVARETRRNAKNKQKGK